MISKDEWVWMPHAGHFILGDQCQFRLNTRIGKFIISTVGEYLPDSHVREVYAKSRGIELEGIGDARESDYLKKIGYEEIGSGRKYETMVFKAKKSERKCCPWEMESASELDSKAYNEPNAAYEGHLRMCEKYATDNKE